MKKFIALSISSILLSSAAFAQIADGISIGVEGEAALVPLIATQALPEQDPSVDADDGGQYTHFGHSDSGGPNYVQVNVAGENPEGTLGFAADLRVYGANSLDLSTATLPATLPGYWTVDTKANVWIKPFESDLLKITLGSFNDDTLRGKVGDSNWYAFTTGSGGPDDIFTRFKGRNGALLSSAPIEGLYIGILAGSDGVNLFDFWAIQPEAKTVYQFVQGAVGYTIEDIGLVRAQYVGKAVGISAASVPATATTPWEILEELDKAGLTYSRAELAFALTAVDGLVIDLGGKVPFLAKDSGPAVTLDPTASTPTPSGIDEAIYQAPYSVSLGAEFAAGDFKITGRVDSAFGSTYETIALGTTARKIEAGPEIGVLLVPEYTLSAIDENLTIGVDISALIHGDTKETISGTAITWAGGFELGFGLWAQKNVSNGYIKAGLGYKLQSVKYANRSDASAYDDVYSQGQLSIPIIVGFEF
jgi:hypothetical protein